MISTISCRRALGTARVGMSPSSTYGDTFVLMTILGLAVLVVVSLVQAASDKRTFRQRMVDQIKHPLG